MTRRRVIPILPTPLPPAPWLTPRLSGEPRRVQQVLGALADALHTHRGQPLPVETWLRELRLEADEAYLAVAPDLGRDGAGLAFDTLRRLLPDTDIYIGAAAA